MGCCCSACTTRFLRLYEGYPLAASGNRRPWKWLYQPLLSHQQRRLAKAEEQTKLDDEAKAFVARWRLDLSFPHDQPGLPRPTSFGNAVRAFERHSMSRWHVNSIGVWPHVEALLSDQEAQVLADARADVAFFVNASLVSAIAVPVLAVEAITAHLTSGWLLNVVVCAIPAALGGLAYWASIGAAQRWGDVVRAAIDLHRRDVYDKLGIREPKNFADEREIAWRLNATLLVGDHLPDDLAAPVRKGGDEAAAPTVGAAVTQLLDRMLTEATGGKDHD